VQVVWVEGNQVVWVEGNHDHGLSNVMSHLVGVKVDQEYQWDFGGCFFQYLSTVHRPFSTGTFMLFEKQRFDELGGFYE
jgi:hypothetical protein